MTGLNADGVLRRTDEDRRDLEAGDGHCLGNIKHIRLNLGR